METGWECITCGVPWDGSEVSADHLPAALERQIAQGWVSRQEAFQAFLRMDDLAEAAADRWLSRQEACEAQRRPGKEGT